MHQCNHIKVTYFYVIIHFNTYIHYVLLLHKYIKGSEHNFLSVWKYVTVQFHTLVCTLVELIAFLLSASLFVLYMVIVIITPSGHQLQTNHKTKLIITEDQSHCHHSGHLCPQSLP